MKEPKSLLFLGRQPKLGLAELESLYGEGAISLLNDNIAVSNVDVGSIDFDRLGGSIKMADIIGTIDSTDWRKVEKILLKQVPLIASSLQEGKIKFGLSIYKDDLRLQEIQATALRIKKAIRAKTNQSVRVIPNKERALSSAQIIHNQLTGQRGIEIVLIETAGQVLMGRTIAEQDIEAYAKRDQNRPKRDARVGMLPPKLAQIITNLGSAKIPPDTQVIGLDPFCGTGVLLQEAALMGFGVYGTDIEARMIDYTRVNLDWLSKEFGTPLDAELETADATAYIWGGKFKFVACEGYLGQPFSAFPSEEKLREVTANCNLIMKKFLKNISNQVQSGTRLCIALPAWHRPNGKFEHLNILDSLEELGYNRVSFVHVRDEELLYYRPDQVVARELLVITRK